MSLSDSELRGGLERALATLGLELAGEVERRPSAYRTSFPLEELRLEIAGEGPATLVFKQLGWEDLEPGGRLAKPRFLHDPEREPAVYGAVLPQAPPGPPRYFGSFTRGGRHWLFVEWVEGRELFQVGERELWEAAARWLARFHVAMEPEQDRHQRAGRLIDHGAGFYRRWIERAREFASDTKTVDWLAAPHEQAVEALLAMPRTVVHGEFYASNVLIAECDPASGSRPTRVGRKPDARVAAVDWELAAVGPGLADLAALVSGWPQEDRRALAAAYGAEPGVPAFSERDLDLVRLQVAVQWLGWAPPEWEPPEGRRHDWLGEAVALAEGLEL